MFIRKYVSIFLLLGMFSKVIGMPYQSSTMQHFVNRCGKSQLMNWGSQGLAKMYQSAISPYTTNELAPLEYQKLGLQCQRSVGIEPTRQVPIFQGTSLMGVMQKKAIAMPGSITINQDCLDKMSYGEKRSLLSHESVHILYNDDFALKMTMLGSFLSGLGMSYSLLYTLQVGALGTAVGSLSGAIGLAMFLSKKYMAFMESRADTEGHYAVQCSSCVLDSASSRDKDYESAQTAFKNAGQDLSIGEIEKRHVAGGYLSRSDLQKIARDLDGQECEYHQKRS